MKEADWLSCTSSEKMLRYLAKIKPPISPRKQRLLACGLCRLIWPHLEERWQEAIETAERHADGLASRDELRQQHDEAMRRTRGRFDIHGIMRTGLDPVSFGIPKWGWEATEGATRPAKPVLSKISFAIRYGGELIAHVSDNADYRTRTNEAGQATLIRHILGNPFRPTRVEAWPATMVYLASAVYDGHDCVFALHDALFEAGHTELAEHFQQETWHPPGCWAVDWILGKK